MATAAGGGNNALQNGSPQNEVKNVPKSSGSNSKEVAESLEKRPAKKVVTKDPNNEPSGTDDNKKDRSLDKVRIVLIGLA